MNSMQQLLLGIYVYCQRQVIIGERIRAVLSNARSRESLKVSEPFAGHSPCIPPIGGDLDV